MNVDDWEFILKLVALAIQKIYQSNKMGKSIREVHGLKLPEATQRMVSKILICFSCFI